MIKDSAIHWEWNYGHSGYEEEKIIDIERLVSIPPRNFFVDELEASYRQMSCSKSYFGELERFLDFLKMCRRTEVRSDLDLKGFLLDNMLLIPYLFEAFYIIWEIFGVDQKICLEVVESPDSEKAKKLVITIITELEPEEALQKLERIDEEWLLFRINELAGKVCITLDYL